MGVQKRIEPRPKCFVSMPYSYPIDLLYDEVIEPAVREAGLESVRADRVHYETIAQGNTLGIRTAKVVVAELTGNNPNVLYEVGLAHASYVPVLLLVQDRDQLPADLRDVGVVAVQYGARESTSQLKDRLTKRLRMALENQEKPLYDKTLTPSRLTLPAASQLAWETMSPVDPELGFERVVEALTKCMDVLAYCGGKGDKGPWYYWKQFEQLKKDRGFAIRRVFGINPEDASFDLCDAIDVLLHVEVQGWQKRGANGVHIRWVEEQRLEKGLGLTLFGANLFAHKGLGEARMTNEPVRPSETFTVSRVRQAHERLWRGPLAKKFNEGHIEHFTKRVRMSRSKKVRAHVENARNAGFELPWYPVNKK